jgi:organic radical activating enzyme
MKKYFVNEIFYTLQGEGLHSGEPRIFVRFGKCNLTCQLESHGFDCDTEFESGVRLTLQQILVEVAAASQTCKWIVLTGGEPALQVDALLIEALHADGYQLAIETNGSIELPQGLDWITVSPKMAEHTIRQVVASEVKYVRSYGQQIPHTVVKADHYLISPAFGPEGLNRNDLEWCMELVKNNPPWRLSCQQHKWWFIR